MHFWLWKDRVLQGHTWSVSLFCSSSFPVGLSVSQSGTIWYIRLHSWPQKYLLFLVCTHLFCHLHFFWFGRSECSAAAVSLLKDSDSHSLCSLPHERAALRNMFASFVCLIKHVIVFELLLSLRFYETWIMSGNAKMCCRGEECMRKTWLVTFTHSSRSLTMKQLFTLYILGWNRRQHNNNNNNFDDLFLNFSFCRSVFQHISFVIKAGICWTYM